MNMEKKHYLLTGLFGASVRIKILETLLENSLQRQIQWLNISEIAKLAGISTSSSKRVIDDLIEQELVDLKPILTHAKNPEKQIMLNLDSPIIRELIFFYRKLKGFS
ncbi:MAG: hypothetical protein ACTSR8_17380 [Promethearchaeota archaeon]